MAVSIGDQKLLLVIIDEYSQDNFPKLPNNYFLLGRWQRVVLAKYLWNKGYVFRLKNTSIKDFAFKLWLNISVTNSYHANW